MKKMALGQKNISKKNFVGNNKTISFLIMRGESINMIGKIFLVAIALMMIFSFAVAEDMFENSVLDIDVQATGLPNTNISNLLSAFGILNTAKINVIDESTQIHYGVTVEDGSVTNVLIGEDVEGANYTVSVNETALTELLVSDNPENEAIQQLKQGNITVTPNGFVETIQLFFFNIFLFFQ